MGTPPNLRWWGSNTAQGQYAYPCLLQWSLTREQKYIDRLVDIGRIPAEHGVTLATGVKRRETALG